MTERQPLLTLDTAIPDRLPVHIKTGEDPDNPDKITVYYMRHPGEYSTFERKRLSSLVTAIVEFEAADELDVQPEDAATYEAALRQLTKIAIPDISEELLARLPITAHGKVASAVVKLFTGGQVTPEMPPPEPTPTVREPLRLRRLADRLILGSRSRDSADSTAAPLNDGSTSPSH